MRPMASTGEMVHLYEVLSLLTSDNFQLNGM